MPTSACPRTRAFATALPANTATSSARIPKIGTSAAYANDWPKSQISFGSTVSPSRMKSNDPENERSRRMNSSPSAAIGTSTIDSHDQT